MSIFPPAEEAEGSDADLEMGGSGGFIHSQLIAKRVLHYHPTPASVRPHITGIMARSGRFPNPALFICDIQERFRPVIYEYPKVIATAQKLIRASHALSVPVYTTTQSSARLGPLCAELFPAAQPPPILIDKTAFSMMVPELRFALQQISPDPYQVAIVGIETHICVTQTALDLLAEGHKVYVLADGVSSCHEGERGMALERLRCEGAVVTTSEGWLYECMGDAGIEGFKEIARLVKETKESTREAVQTLCKM